MPEDVVQGVVVEVVEIVEAVEGVEFVEDVEIVEDCYRRNPLLGTIGLTGL